MLYRNKKALSEIVGYTLLIIIALAMAGSIYAFLKVYVPKAQPQCPEDINLVVQDYNCSASVLSLQITNRGLFNVDAAYIRLGKSESKIRPQINANSVLFIKSTPPYSGLNPGEIFSKDYSVAGIVTEAGKYTLEVEPAILQNNKYILCKNSIMTQEIDCTL